MSEHRAVDPVFGDLAVFDRLMADTHGHDLRLLIDWVRNHTIDRHPGSWSPGHRGSP